MIRNYFRNWNVIRIIRLVAGIWIAIEGVRSGEWLFVLMGGLFALMPLMNVGCGSTAGCGMPPRRRMDPINGPNHADEVTYHEVK